MEIVVHSLVRDPYVGDVDDRPCCAKVRSVIDLVPGWDPGFSTLGGPWHETLRFVKNPPNGTLGDFFPAWWLSESYSSVAVDQLDSPSGTIQAIMSQLQQRPEDEHDALISHPRHKPAARSGWSHEDTNVSDGAETYLLHCFCAPRPDPRASLSSHESFPGSSSRAKQVRWPPLRQAALTDSSSLARSSCYSD